MRQEHLVVGDVYPTGNVKQCLQLIGAWWDLGFDSTRQETIYYEEAIFKTPEKKTPTNCKRTHLSSTNTTSTRFFNGKDSHTRGEHCSTGDNDLTYLRTQQGTWSSCFCTKRFRVVSFYFNIEGWTSLSLMNPVLLNDLKLLYVWHYLCKRA